MWIPTENSYLSTFEIFKLKWPSNWSVFLLVERRAWYDTSDIRFFINTYFIRCLIILLRFRIFCFRSTFSGPAEIVMKEDICMIYTEGLPELPGNRFEKSIHFYNKFFWKLKLFRPGIFSRNHSIQTTFSWHKKAQISILPFHCQNIFSYIVIRDF